MDHFHKEPRVSPSPSVPDAFQRALPFLSADTILQAAAAFQAKVLSSHPLYKRSVFALALPLAVQHEPFMYAWASAILIAIPGDSTQWRRQSVECYGRAVSGLKQAILSESPIEEWKRATALLCHALEILQPVQSSQLARSHLQGAHRMFQLAKNYPGLPASEHDTLLFEAYIMRTATNCLLQQDIHQVLPFDHIRHMASMHQRALDRLNLEMSPLSSPWLAATTIDLVDAMYKASWLNAHMPLSKAQIVEALSIWDFLITAREESSQDPDPSQYDTDKAMGSVYLCACQVLLGLSLPDEYYDMADKEATIDMGIRDMDLLTRSSTLDTSLQWPLIILGSLATTQDHQRICREIAARFNPKVPQQTVDSILSFWKKTHQLENKRLCFEDCDLLRAILL
ncbi:hypothetical protein Q7P37_001812 [Cladosporium fusiforme]